MFKNKRCVYWIGYTKPNKNGVCAIGIMSQPWAINAQYTVDAQKPMVPTGIKRHCIHGDWMKLFYGEENIQVIMKYEYQMDCKNYGVTNVQYV